MTENKVNMTYFDAFDKIRETMLKDAVQEAKEKMELGDFKDIDDIIAKISRRFYDQTTSDYQIAFPEHRQEVLNTLAEDREIACKFYKEKAHFPTLQKAIVINLLTQDAMRSVYAKSHIPPADVKEFITKQTESPNMSDIIEHHAMIYNEAAREDISGNDKILAPTNGKSKEHLQYVNSLSSNSFFGKAMNNFAVQKAMERAKQKKEMSKLEKLMHKAGKYFKAFLEAGRIAVIATGIAGSACISYELIKDNENDKTNTENKTPNVKSNNADSKTYTSWADKFNDDRH